MVGQLPWRQIIDKPKAQNIKENTNFYGLLEPYDEAYFLTDLYDYLRTLEFYDEPNYDSLLVKAKGNLDKIGVKMNDPFDWEQIKQ